MDWDAYLASPGEHWARGRAICSTGEDLGGELRVAGGAGPDGLDRVAGEAAQGPGWCQLVLGDGPPHRRLRVPGQGFQGGQGLAFKSA